MYFRKGGRGLSDKKSLRQQYNYYSKRAMERAIYEKAFRVGLKFKTDVEVVELFKPQTYDELFREGITRKEGNKTIRYTGIEAVKIKIESYKARASKNVKAESFILNYLKAMEEVGYGIDEIQEVDILLHSISVDKLTYSIHAEFLPQISYIYAEERDNKSIVEKIKKMVKFVNSEEVSREIRTARKSAKVVAKNRMEEYKMIYGDRFM